MVSPPKEQFVKGLDLTRPAVLFAFNCLILGMLTIAAPDVYADCSCQKGSNGVYSFGLEYIATECPVDPLSESHYYHYLIYAVRCPGTTIQNYAFYGDTQAPPGGLGNYLVSQGYRVLRNNAGTHIMAVSRYFTGVIAGINFASLTAGIYYADIDQTCCHLPGNAYSCSGLPEDLDSDGYSVCYDCDDTNADLTAECPVTAPDDIYNGRQACTPASRFGNPVTFYNGNKFETRTDISFPSPFLNGFLFQAFYNSRREELLPLGYGWSHSFSDSLDPDYQAGQIRIVDATGRAHLFESIGVDMWQAMFGESCTVAFNNDEYIWEKPSGNIYAFDSTGRLSWVQDSVGNRQVMTYDDNGRLASVSDSSSGRAIILHYNASGLIDYVSGPVTDAVPDGIWVRYQHDEHNNLTGILYADSSGFSYGYDDVADQHNLTWKKDAMNHTLATWEYDGQDRAVKSITPDGRGGSASYVDESTVEVTDAYGIKKTYSIELINGVKRTVSASIASCPSCPMKEPVRYGYDEELHIIEKEYANGRTDRFSDFDDRGNACTVIRAWEAPEETTVHLTYHPDTGSVMSRSEISVLNSSGVKEIIWDYDSDNNTIPNEDPGSLIRKKIERGYTWDASQQLIPYEYVTTFEYNDAGQITAVDGPLPGDSDKISITYFAATGDIHTITWPLVGSIVYDNYDTAGNPHRVTDFNNTTTFFQYDGRNRMIRYTRNGISTSVSYNQAGAVEMITDGEGRSLSYLYNPRGFLSKILNDLSNALTYEYDQHGNISLRAITDSTETRHFVETENYNNPDQPGRLWKRTTHDNDETILTYDIMGNIETVTNGRGHTTQYTYDLLNRVETVTEASVRTVTYEHDSHGNIVEVTHPTGLKTSYVYDDHGNVLKISSPDSGVTLNTYDANGRLYTSTDANGVTKVYHYDALGRLLSIDYPDDPDAIFLWDTAMTGRLYSARNGYSSLSFGYDNQGNISTQTLEISGRTFRLSYEYDNTGRITAMTLPGGRRVEYELDVTGRISNIATEINGISHDIVSDINHAPLGPVSGMIYGNGLSLSKSLNESYEITGINVGGTLDKGYSYLPDSLVEAITDNLDMSQSQHFAYDDVARLSTAQGSYGDFDYEYDAADNRLTLSINSALTTSYQYIAETNMLSDFSTGLETAYCDYDNHGNTVRKGNLHFSYNQANRLEKVRDETGNIIAEYGYNVLEQRVFKKTASGTVYFVHDLNGNLVMEYDASNGKVVEYIWLGHQPLARIDASNICTADLDMDGDVDGKDLAGAGTASINIADIAAHFGEADCSGGSESVYYYHTDHLGTPQVITDSTGAIVWEAQYLPFGKVVVSPSSTIHNNIRFPGQYYDPETGLHYNWHRYYDPETGRYLTPDPIGLAGGINLYGYTLNNPINKIDPKGLTVCVGGGLGGTLGFVSINFSIHTNTCCKNGKVVVRTVASFCVGWKIGLSFKLGGDGTGRSAASVSFGRKLKKCKGDKNGQYQTYSDKFGFSSGVGVFGASWSQRAPTVTTLTAGQAGISFHIMSACHNNILQEVNTMQCCFN